MATFLQSWLCAAATFGLIGPLQGCATLARGTTETFVVEAFPTDALITTSFGGSCRQSPCAFPGLSREAEFTVRIERVGYQPQVHTIGHRFAGGAVPNMVSNGLLPVGGTIGILLDSNNGATQQLTPNPLRATLQPDPR